MKKYQVFLILCAVALVCISATITFYSFFYIKEIKTLDMDLKVGDYVGINADTDALHFGTISPGGVGTKSVTLSNNYEEKLAVKIKLYGDLAGFIDVKRDFVLYENQSEKIAFTARVPQDAPYGNYTGRVVFVFKRG